MYLNIANAGCYSTGWTKACSWLVPHYQSSNSTVLLEREREKAAFRQVAKQWPVKAPWFPSRIMSITTLANKLLFMLWTNYWPLSTSFGNISIQLHILKLFLPQISVCHWNLPRRPCIQPYHQEALKPRRTAVKIDPENGSHTKQCLDVDLLMCKSIGDLFYIILCDVCLKGCVHFTIPWSHLRPSQHQRSLDLGRSLRKHCPVCSCFKSGINGIGIKIGAWDFCLQKSADIRERCDKKTLFVWGT